MLTVFFLAPSNHPEWVNIRLVSGEEKQMNTFEVKNQHQSYWCVDGRVLFKKVDNKNLYVDNAMTQS